MKLRRSSKALIGLFLLILVAIGVYVTLSLIFEDKFKAYEGIIVTFDAIIWFGSTIVMLNEYGTFSRGIHQCPNCKICDEHKIREDHVR